MTAELAKQLEAVQQRCLELLGQVNFRDACTQYHPDLSPLAWHAGHAAFVENYWIREVVLGDDAFTAPWHDLYFPEQSPKAARGAALAEHAGLAESVARHFAENRQLLLRLDHEQHPHALLANDYLWHFLIQHHSQHTETMQMILGQRALAQRWPTFRCREPLQAQPPQLPARRFGGEASIGHAGGPQAYDNELAQHRVSLEPFVFGSQPVSNAEYLGFIEADGYHQAQYWSVAGCSWRETNQAVAPQHWRRDADGHWFAIERDGPQPLEPAAPVYGINYFEAQAFAAYAGCRLPHEQEWEHAVTRDAALWSSSGRAWEWCNNAFYPYPGFEAFPYASYSTPWFDDHHFSLRGGSMHTCAAVRRPTFRNFYTAEKRHIFAGLRLAAQA